MGYYMSIGQESFNYTYNVADMWYDCYDDKGIRKHYGLNGKQAFPVLQKLRDHMEDNMDRLIKMDPENGWGDYFGALLFVNKLIIASLKNQTEIWEGD